MYRIKNNNITNITIYKHDLNGYSGADILNITVITPSRKMHKFSIPDDGITERGKKGKILNKTIRLDEAGMYTLIMENNGDMLISLLSNEAKVLYEGDLLIYDASPVYFYVGNVTAFKAQAVSHWRNVLPNTIKIYDGKDRLIASINITERNKWKSVKIEVPTNSKNQVWKAVPQKVPYRVKLSGIPSVFFFNKDNLFDPYSNIAVEKQEIYDKIALVLIAFAFIIGTLVLIKRKPIYLKLAIAILILACSIYTMSQEVNILIISKTSVNIPEQDGLNVEWTKKAKNYNLYDLIIVTPEMLKSVWLNNKKRVIIVGKDALMSDNFWSKFSIKTKKYPYHLPETFLFLSIFILSTINFRRIDLGELIFTYSLLAFLFIQLYTTITEIQSFWLKNLLKFLIIMIFASGIKIALKSKD